MFQEDLSQHSNISEVLAKPENKTSSVAEAAFKFDRNVTALKNRTSSLEEDVTAQGTTLFKSGTDNEELSEHMALQENRTFSLAKDVTSQGNALHDVNQGMSKNADIVELSEGLALQENKTSLLVEEFFEIDQDMAAYENQTSSLAEGVMEQGNVINEVNWELSENMAFIGEQGEGMARQENGTSSLAEDVTSQGNALLDVNQGMSKNAADIEELSGGMALQEGQLLLREIQEVNKSMLQQKEELQLELYGQRQIIGGQKDLTKGQKEIIGGHDEPISRPNHTVQGLLPDPVDCLVSSWSAWGSCSKTCGGGTMSRRREIAQQPLQDGLACPVLEEERACNTEPCEGMT